MSARPCSDRAKAAARLVYQDGLSRADAARALGVPLATLRGLLEQYRQYEEDRALVAGLRD